MSLLAIPPELLRIIGKACGRPEQCALARVNRRLHAIVNPILYRHNLFRDNPIDSCIFWAAQHGRLDTLKTAAAYGADLNDNRMREDDRTWMRLTSTAVVFASPLHLAIKYKHREIITWLLEKNVNLNVASKNLCNCAEFPDSWYPLHTAMCVGDESTASLLIERGAFMSTPKTTGIHCAARLGYVRLLDALTQRPEFDPYGEPSELNWLHYATLCPDEDIATEMVHMLRNRGVPVNRSEGLDMVLSSVVIEGRFKVALALLDRGASIEEISLYMVFPSSHQAEYNLEEMERDNDRRQDRAELMLRVITAIEDLESEEVWDDEHVSTPLFQVAAYAFDANCVQLLLDAGARIDSTVYFNRDWHNQPAVPQTMMWGILNIVDGDGPDLPRMSTGRLMELKASIRLLLQHGASLNSLDGSESALEFACSHPKILHSGLLECLVKNASASNVSLKHIEAVMKRCGDDGRDETAILLKQMHETVSKGAMKVKTKSRREERDNKVERSE